MLTGQDSSVILAVKAQDMKHFDGNVSVQHT